MQTENDKPRKHVRTQGKFDASIFAFQTPQNQCAGLDVPVITDRIRPIFADPGEATPDERVAALDINSSFGAAYPRLVLIMPIGQ